MYYATKKLLNESTIKSKNENKTESNRPDEEEEIKTDDMEDKPDVQLEFNLGLDLNSELASLNDPNLPTILSPERGEKSDRNFNYKLMAKDVYFKNSEHLKKNVTDNWKTFRKKDMTLEFNSKDDAQFAMTLYFFSIKEEKKRKEILNNFITNNFTTDDREVTQLILDQGQDVPLTFDSATIFQDDIGYYGFIYPQNHLTSLMQNEYASRTLKYNFLMYKDEFKLDVKKSDEFEGRKEHINKKLSIYDKMSKKDNNYKKGSIPIAVGNENIIVKVATVLKRWEYFKSKKFKIANNVYIDIIEALTIFTLFCDTKKAGNFSRKLSDYVTALEKNEHIDCFFYFMMRFIISFLSLRHLIPEQSRLYLITAATHFNELFSNAESLYYFGCDNNEVDKKSKLTEACKENYEDFKITFQNNYNNFYMEQYNNAKERVDKKINVGKLGKHAEDYFASLSKRDTPEKEHDDTEETDSTVNKKENQKDVKKKKSKKTPNKKAKKTTNIDNDNIAEKPIDDIKEDTEAIEEHYYKDQIKQSILFSREKIDNELKFLSKNKKLDEKNAKFISDRLKKSKDNLKNIEITLNKKNAKIDLFKKAEKLINFIDTLIEKCESIKAQHRKAKKRDEKERLKQFNQRRRFSKFNTALMNQIRKHQPNLNPDIGGKGGDVYITYDKKEKIEDYWYEIQAKYHNRLCCLHQTIVDMNTNGEWRTRPILSSQEALGFYVTQSSKSGALFCISVHYWKLRDNAPLDNQNIESTANTQLQPMDKKRYYDTFKPCMVLHVHNKIK